MFKKILFPILAISIGLILAGYFVGCVGSLTGTVIMAAGTVLLGMGLVIFSLLEKKNQKQDIKAMIGMLVFGILLTFMSGKSLAAAALDYSEGCVEIRLEECEVSGRTRVGSFLSSYYLEGTDMNGEKRKFSLDRETYNKYSDQWNFSVHILGWERSNVIKEIY